MPLLQLQLVDSGGTLALDVEGEPIIEQEYEYTQANFLARYVERWRMAGGMLSLGTTATHTTATDTGALWDKIDTLLAFTGDRETSPVTGARIVRDPAGTPVVERLLSTSTFQRFRIEDITIGERPVVSEAEGGRWEVLVRVDLTVVAERVFTDGDSIVDYSQTIDYEYTRGFQRVTWTTIVETAEGVDAEPKARTLGKIPIDEYGANYHWVTNGADGVNIRVLDGDERTTARGSSEGGDGAGAARAPTRVEATSIIQQTGGPLGGNTAGNSPQDVSFSVRTETNRNLRTTTWTAHAEGPQGKVWVAGKAPAGDMTVRVTDYDDETRIYDAVWIREEILTTDSRISAVISGGAKQKEWRGILNGRRPRLQIGPFTAYVLTITVRKEYVGAAATNANMQLPAITLFADEWVFDANASNETVMPSRLEPAATEGQQKWERVATLVFRSGAKPSDLKTLATKLLPAAGATAEMESYYAV